MKKFENTNSVSLILRNEDIRSMISLIYKQELGVLRNLETLVFENCKIDLFAPKVLPASLKELSLEENQLHNLDI